MAASSKPLFYWVDRNELATFESPRPSFAGRMHSADDGISAFLSEARPFARVCLLRIQPRGPGDLLDGVSRPLAGRPDRVERLLVEQMLYDLTPLGKAMCLAVGRNPDCQFQPAVDLGLRFFTQPHPTGLGYRDELDTAVSREHGWVIADGAERVLFCVVGTDENPGNGILWNDEERVTARTVPWRPDDFLGLGRICKNAPDQKPPLISIFRMRLQRITINPAAETRPAQ